MACTKAAVTATLFCCFADGARVKAGLRDLISANTTMAPLEAGEECLDACGGNSGHCDRCPAGQACCRKGWTKRCWLGGCDASECKRAYDWKSEGSHECVPIRPTVQVFKNDEIEDVLVMAPDDYPDNLKGIIWMDQVGFYGHSDITDGAPDGCVSFGDSRHPLNKEKRTQFVDTCGPGWSWFNNPDGYHMFATGGEFGFKYQFEWNEDYTHAQIWPMVSSISVPKGLASFTIGIQESSFDTSICPPAQNATKKEIARCAKWARKSTVIGGGGEPFYYYAYQIVDKNGERVQPYYDKYVEWTNRHSNFDRAEAYKNGVINADLEATGMQFCGL